MPASALDFHSGAVRRKTPTKTVVCGDCGTAFELSYRNEYEARVVRKEQPRCWQCRYPGKPLTEAQGLRYRQWWLKKSGYSLEELREIAYALWPELDRRGHRIDSPASDVSEVQPDARAA